MSERTYTQEELDAAVTAAVTSRVKNHGAKVADLQSQIDELTKRADEGAGALKERDKALKRLGEVEAQLGETTDRLALSGVGISDDKAAKRLRAAYRTDVEGVDKPPSFAEWLAGDGAEDVARYGPKGDAPAGKVEPKVEALAGTGATTRTTTLGTKPAAAPAKMTPEQYAARTSKLLDERAKLPVDKRKEIDAQMTALKAEYAGQAQPVS